MAKRTRSFGAALENFSRAITQFTGSTTAFAIAFGTINVVGGFLVTDRMLEMFKGRKRKDAA